MKFAFDNRTGEMRPQKDNQIYFNRSMSGGLRIDDKLNNVKYIIERDGSIKNIFGVMKDVNIYDQRNAHIIADRVKRMFGPSHKYSNYKRFLKGYHLIESFEEFVNEGFLSKTINRAKDGTERLEAGKQVKTPMGTILMDDKGCGVPCVVNKETEEYYTTIKVNNEELYLFGYEDDGTFTYFLYNETGDDEEPYELEQLATAEYDMTTDDFILIRAMLDLDSNNRDMEFKDNDSYYTCEMGREEYMLFDDHDKAEEMAIEWEKSSCEGCGKDMIKHWIDSFGEDIIDYDFEGARRESNENYVNDIESENGDHGNRLFDELIQNEIIEDTEEYFELIEPEDEEGELDYDSPKFDVDDAKEQYIDILCDDGDDAEWYFDNFVDDGLEDYIDYDKLAEKIIEDNGVGGTLSSYDGNEYEFFEDDYEIYIYRVN